VVLSLTRAEPSTFFLSLSYGPMSFPPLKSSPFLLLSNPFYFLSPSPPFTFLFLSPFHFFRLQPEALTLSSQLALSNIDPNLYTLNASLLSTLFYQPQYPANNICTEYSTKCASLIAVANQSALVPQCESTVPFTGIKKFPGVGVSQVVNVAYLPLTPKNVSEPTVKKSVFFTTAPNPFFASNDLGYNTQCPEGKKDGTWI
jgi:hypothetical protein